MAGDMKLEPVVVHADRVAEIVDSLPLGAVVVVCDVDGDRAAAVAERVTRHRTAVFVGDLSCAADREQADAFCRDMFGGAPTAIVGPPGGG